MSAQDVMRPEQFFHGTRRQFSPGEMIEPGHKGNHARSADTGHAHVYAAERVASAGVMAGAARPKKNRPRVYEVEPTGPVERDPEDSGGSLGWWRSTSPMRVVRDLT